MAPIVVELRTPASPARVWRALTDPAEVEQWAGVTALDVPPGYPVAGQHARWRARVGPIPVTLHDRVRAVEPGRRLAAVLDLGPVHVEEEYRLGPDAAGTVLVSENHVEARVPGLGPLARRLVRADVERAMAGLGRLCAGDQAG